MPKFKVNDWIIPTSLGGILPYSPVPSKVTEVVDGFYRLDYDMLKFQIEAVDKSCKIFRLPKTVEEYIECLKKEIPLK